MDFSFPAREARGAGRSPRITIFQFARDNAALLLAGALLTFTSSFGQTFFISIFAGAIRAAFGLSHGAWGAIYSAGTNASASTMIWAGALADRFRVRRLGAAVLIGIALSCAFMALLPQSGCCRSRSSGCGSSGREC